MSVVKPAGTADHGAFAGAWDWLSTSQSWWGDSGILNRIAEHLSYTALAMVLAVVIGAKKVLSRVAARMTTADLVAMNQRSSRDEKAGAALIAREWLDGH